MENAARMPIDLAAMSNKDLIKLRADIPAEVARRRLCLVREAAELGEPLPVEANPGPLRKPVVAKYRDPDTGKTWAGRGLRPKWVKPDMRIGAPSMSPAYANGAAEHGT